MGREVFSKFRLGSWSKVCEPLFWTNRLQPIGYFASWFCPQQRTQTIVALGNPSGMCAKLRTGAANDNRDHASQSLLFSLLSYSQSLYSLIIACSRHEHIFVLRVAISLLSYYCLLAPRIYIQSLYSLIIACSRHEYIFLFFALIPFVVNHTINTTPPETLQHYQECLKFEKKLNWQLSYIQSASTGY